jgi:hypothetical protein
MKATKFDMVFISRNTGQGKEADVIQATAAFSSKKCNHGFIY